MRATRAGAAAGCALSLWLWLGAAAADGPGLRAPLFEPAPAGSYQLPVIDRVGDHRLLDSGGVRSDLLGLAPDECALVAFVYLGCSDASGCPASLLTLQRVDRALAGQAELAGRARLVTVSFDPARDRPEQLAGLRRSLAPRGRWRFLTAADAAELQPVLEDFGQDAVPLLTPGGAHSGILRHVAKVFLVDGEGAVRNIYSSGFLDARVLLRDVETLLMETAGRRTEPIGAR